MKRQEHNVPQTLQKQFSDYLEECIGFSFSQEQWKFIEKKLPALAKEFGFSANEPFIEWLVNTRLTHTQISKLAEHLTIKETYFFREPHVFKIIEEKILPQLILERSGKHQNIHIWCTACCTGEEPFTIAIILSRLMFDPKAWNISIFGTDINVSALEVARKGLYRDWSLRATPDDVKQKFFTHIEEGTWELAPRIREMVTFAYSNVVANVDFFNMDIILCNNLLIYFSKKQIQNAVKKLVDALAVGGWLIVSPVEIPFINDPRIKPAVFDNITLFQKVKA